MDFVGLIVAGIGLVERFAARARKRPKLKVQIVSFRPDQDAGRWVFRTKVTNIGGVKAKRVEAFWSVFDASYNWSEGGMSVFWSPESDNDHDYEDRSRRTRDLEGYDRTYCWAEIDICASPVKGTDTCMFPYDSSPGRYYIAVILEYGSFKAFDFVGLKIDARIEPCEDFSAAFNKIDVSWDVRKGVRGVKARRALAKTIRRWNYHDSIRPL
jgi:hypothetical protein